MNFNIDYLMQHISYELHTIVKNWTGHLSSQTKLEVICTRKDISDEYLPFSVFRDSILSAEDNVFVLYTDEFTYKPAFPGTERSYSYLLLQFLLFLLQCASGP